MLGQCKINYKLQKKTLSNPAFTNILYLLKFSLLLERARFKPNMWSSSHHYDLMQQGNGNLEVESEEGEVSQYSYRRETEPLELWSRIHYEAQKRHETHLNALIDRSILNKRRFRKCGSYYSRKEKREES